VYWSAADVQRLAARLGVAGATASAAIARLAPVAGAVAPMLRGVEDKSRQFTFTISTSGVDRLPQSDQIYLSWATRFSRVVPRASRAARS
jgi:hypothetical protein